MLPARTGRQGRPFADARTMLEAIVFRYRCFHPVAGSARGLRDLAEKWGPGTGAWPNRAPGTRCESPLHLRGRAAERPEGVGESLHLPSASPLMRSGPTGFAAPGACPRRHTLPTSTGQNTMGERWDGRLERRIKRAAGDLILAVPSLPASTCARTISTGRSVANQL